MKIEVKCAVLCNKLYLDKLFTMRINVKGSRMTTKIKLNNYCVSGFDTPVTQSVIPIKNMEAQVLVK